MVRGIELHKHFGPAHGFKTRYWADLDSPDHQGLQARVLSQHLLYCHSVAISNQLSFILDFFDPFLKDLKQKWRLLLENYLVFLSQIKPLIEAEVVILVEPNYGSDPQTTEKFG